MNMYSIFTKPFKSLSVDELAKKVTSLGFNAIEFPLRDGFQVEPANAVRDLPKFAETLSGYGIKISSVAGSTDEHVFEACAKTGVKILRIMAPGDKDKTYFELEKEFIDRLEKIVPLTQRYGVTLGIQNHYGKMASSTMELYRIIERFDPKNIAAIWDAAHSGLAGEVMDSALDIIYDRMCLINFKNAYYKRVNGPEAPAAKWKPYFTLGRHGQADYAAIVAYIKKRGYAGDICLPAEYTDEASVESLVVEELAYIKSLM